MLLEIGEVYRTINERHLTKSIFLNFKQPSGTSRGVLTKKHGLFSRKR